MDEGLSKAVREVFVRLYEEGLIYRGDYIINWCPRCHTALSDLESEHEEVKGGLYHIRYPFKNGKGYLVVATTRPETLLGDTAVAVNPEDPRYQNLPDDTVLLPLIGRELPIVRDSYVSTDFGTGALKITPAHDPNDFMIGQKHGLESIRVMDDNGTINQGGRALCRVGPLRGPQGDAGRPGKAGPHGKAGRVPAFGGSLLPLQNHGGAHPLQAVVRQGGSPGREALKAVQDGRTKIVPRPSGKRPITSG